MKLLSHFITQKKGGLAVIFAIIFPFVLSFLALSLDGSKILIKRARLADALHEAALVVATDSAPAPDEQEKKRLEGLMERYLNAYLSGDLIKNRQIEILSNNQDASIFHLTAQIEVKTLLPVKMVPAFSPIVTLANQGKVRKGAQRGGQPGDYVFVVDFSSSMGGIMPGRNKIDILKKVVKDITTKALTNFPESTFAIVPFDVGVPVKYPNGQGANELGGDIVGCSFLVVQKPDYQINYNFWADKPHYLIQATSLNMVKVILDSGRYYYFKKYVLPSLKKEKKNPKLTMADLITEGFCENTSRTASIVVQQILPTWADGRITCEKGFEKNPRFIYNPDNEKIINTEWQKAIQTFKKIDLYNSPLHMDVTNLEATVDNMFDEKNIITFPLNYGKTSDWEIKPLSNSCQSAGADDLDVDTSGEVTAFLTHENLAQAKQHTYLIEPTNKLSELENFQNAVVAGETHSSSGLLRAVPEMLKGKNSRKIMIIISDGEDGKQFLETKDYLHKKLKICDRIREGVKARTNASGVDIFYISMSLGSDSLEHIAYWGEYCTGEDNAVAASDYSQLMEKLTEFMDDSEETGYFHN